MMSRGLIARQKNCSMGGTGWVYWIDNVALVRECYPALEPYFSRVTPDDDR
jgi:hypothetical protein